MYSSKPVTPSAGPTKTIADFNARFGLGTPVRYWRGFRIGAPTGSGTTRSEAYLLGAEPVIWITGCTGCIALTHVEVLP